jgi:hypothetical protein
MPRAEFSPSTKRLAADRAKEHCEMIWNGERCNAPLRKGCYHYDHIDPDHFSKDNSLENCCVCCVPCHRLKTGLIDQPKIARSNRIRDRERGIKPTSGRELPCKRNSPFKMKLNRQIVDRRTGEPVKGFRS